MPIGRAARIGFLLSPAAVLLGVGVWFAGWRAGPSQTDPNPVRLVVLLVFDQMRGDYPDRWAPAFGPDGFERLKRDGVWYANCHLPFACTTTASGHASLATGAPPSAHGIVGNVWFLRDREQPVYCAVGERPHRRVPPSGLDRLGAGGMSPEHLLVPTVGDVLRTATGGRARVVSLSLKDRGAVLAGGTDPTAVYCFDTEDGRFHTSAYYRERIHPWAEAFNESGAADRWLGKVWDRSGPAELYDRLAGPDDVAGEGTRPDGSDRVFPHPLPSEPGKAYYSALEHSPFGNELLWEFARAAVVGEDLGGGEAPDFLCVSFSASDLLGHVYGPDSHEVLDSTVRADRLLAEAIAFLDGHVGAGRYVLVVASDHGVAPMPESKTATPGARRLSEARLTAGLEAALDETFGREGDAAGRWVAKDFRATFPWLYLNERYIEGRGLTVADVERYVEQWLGNRPGVQAAFGRRRLERDPFPDGDLGRSVQLAYHPARCGDVCVVLKPYTLPGGAAAKGTVHGSAHPYDTHVPVLAFGAGIPALGRRGERVSAIIVAPLLCRALGIDTPTFATEPLPKELMSVR
jgi:hypothetical protein